MKAIKIVTASIGEYKKYALLGPLFTLLEALMETLIPFTAAILINNIKAGCGMDVILKYGGLLFLMAVISLALGVNSGRFSARASTGLARNLRKRMFYSVQEFSFENIDHFQTSSLVTRMTTDVQNVQQAFMMLMIIGCRGPFMLIFSFLMAFLMGGRMAIIFAFTAPILATGLFLVARKTMPVFKRIFKKYDALNSSIQENISGMRVVKSFVREEYEKQKFGVRNEDIRREFTGAEMMLAINMPMMQFCLYMVMLFVLSFGSYTIIQSKGLELDVGQFSALLTYSFQIMMSLMMLTMILVMLTMSMESASRIAEVLEEKTAIQSPENPVTLVKDGSVDFDHVFFKYSQNAENYVLSDISLHIKSGETIGIIGDTGSCKSSLIRLIPRLYDVTEGNVKVGGINVTSYDLTSLRDQVSVVLQKNELFTGTIRENLKWGNENASDQEIREACRMAQAIEFIDQFPDGLDTGITQGGTNVSGGQKQRLCIARALLKKPKIIIFDDSTSAVDNHTDMLIRKALKSSLPDVTKIIIAQRLSSVEEADRIVIMKNGRIENIGSHRELLETSDFYREIYSSQNRVSEEDVMGSAEERHA